MAQTYDGETIATLLDDPMIRAMMRADHVAPAALEASLRRVAARLRPVRSVNAGRPGLFADKGFAGAAAKRTGADAFQTCVGW